MGLPRSVCFFGSRALASNRARASLRAPPAWVRISHVQPQSFLGLVTRNLRDLRGADLRFASLRAFSPEDFLKEL